MDQLPPITQNGTDSFGCLVNGQPWLPDGPVILSYWPAYTLTYDPTKTGGSLRIGVFRYNEALKVSEGFEISGMAIASVGSYAIDGVGCGVYYNSLSKGPCREYFNSQFYNPGGLKQVQGQLNISRLDLGKKIISGTFYFTLSRRGCDTVKVTQGRFDRTFFP